MTYYYLGYFAEKLGQTQKAQEYYQQAMAIHRTIVFPFQSKAIDVLRRAIEANPRDARAPYYLGNVLYDWQPEEATRMWEASEALDPSFAMTHRNLGTADMHQSSGANIDRAIAELEQAVQLEHKYALHITELDELYEQAGTSLEKRLKLFQQNASMVARRDDSLNRDVALQIATLEVDHAIRTMTEHTLAVAEGDNLNVVDHRTDAHILRARTEIREKRYGPALTDLQAGTTIPPNLPASFESGGANVHDSEIGYLSGLAYQGQGAAQKATECRKRVVAPSGPGSRTGQSRAPGAGVQTYYQSLAFGKLGQEEKAQELFRSLVQSGQNGMKQAAASTDPRSRCVGREVSPRLQAVSATWI